MKRLWPVGLALLALGCVPKVAVRRLEQPAVVAVAYVLDSGKGGGPAEVPPALKARIADALQSRNLQVQEVPFAAVAAGFEAARDSRLRYRQMAAKAGEAPFLLLIEARASLFSQLSGRYRWSVSARVTAGRAGTEPAAEGLNVPAMLDFDHEREPEALTVAASAIADRAAALLDSFIAAPSP